MKPKFGDKVLVGARLKRELKVDIYPKVVQRKERVRHLQVRLPWTIFLGSRWLRNGIRDHDHDAGYTFAPEAKDDPFEAFLVCGGPNTNPYYALPEDVEVAP